MVTPSWDEPFGLVAAEALACGTPVAAYARGALPEILDHAPACWSRPGDVDALAAAIRGRPRRWTGAPYAAAPCGTARSARMVDGYEAIYLEAAGVGAA